MSGEKLSPSTTNDDKAAIVQSRYVDLDEQRRAALAEIDNASFSCVCSAYLFPSPFSPCVIDGSTSKFAWSPVLASSPMRMWSCDTPSDISLYL